MSKITDRELPIRCPSCQAENGDVAGGKFRLVGAQRINSLVILAIDLDIIEELHITPEAYTRFRGISMEALALSSNVSCEPDLLRRTRFFATINQFSAGARNTPTML
jgi:hypothetical protein